MPFPLTRLFVGLFSYFQCPVFGCFHNFALTRPFIVNAAQVKDTMDDCSVKFLIIRSLELFGVGFYSVQTDEKIAGKTITLTIIESNDIRVVIVLQILAIYLQYFFVRTENIRDFTDFLPYVAATDLIHSVVSLF